MSPTPADKSAAMRAGARRRCGVASTAGARPPMWLLKRGRLVAATAATWSMAVCEGGGGTAVIDFHNSLEVPMCSDACGAGVGEPEVRCGIYRGGEFWSHVADSKCVSIFPPKKEDQSVCYGSAPVVDFCESCAPRGAATCFRCAPGFELQDFECKNAELQVLLEVGVASYLNTAWQLEFRPKLEDCLSQIVGAGVGDLAGGTFAEENALWVHPYAVEAWSEREDRDKAEWGYGWWKGEGVNLPPPPEEEPRIVVRAVVPVPAGVSAAAVREHLLGLRYAEAAAELHATCPKLTGALSATVLCPGAVTAYDDGSCPALAMLLVGRPRASWPLRWWDLFLLFGAIAALASYAWSRRSSRRDVALVAGAGGALTAAPAKESQLAEVRVALQQV